MINLLNDFNSLKNDDSKDILYSVESSKMNDGVAIVDNYTLNDLLYSTSYYNVIYILNNKKSFDLNYKFIRDKDENCIYVCTNLFEHTGYSTMDSSKFYKKIIDYLLIEDQVFNYDNKINSFKEAYYDLKEKLFKSNYISEDTLLNGIGFIKKDNNIIATVDSIYINKEEKNYCIDMKDIVGNLNNLESEDNILLEFHQKKDKKKILFNNIKVIKDEENDNFMIIQYQTCSMEDDNDNISYVSKQDCCNDDIFIEERTKFFTVNDTFSSIDFDDLIL